MAVSFASLAHYNELYDVDLALLQQVRVVDGKAVVELLQVHCKYSNSILATRYTCG